ncbi:MAG TPA: ATP-binding protein [Acidimicrobiia bacterium]|nr:ATP-binding protein [Acidimicrobiia bacterium]
MSDNRPVSGTRVGAIPARLTLAVIPIVVVALAVGGLAVWALAMSDVMSGSTSTMLAVVVAAVVFLAVWGTLVMVRRQGRSMSHRIVEVSTAARRVATKDLVELLDALRNPESDQASISPMSLDTEDDDEIADLARSLEELHGSLIEVGARQMEALRAGVSAIFVTLARRNSSLVDRQLALLDQLEAREDDQEVLGGFYQLDHLAARMRRNAESLLVLAGSDAPRTWARATEMSDVVRAAVSEIDEYQRIEVLALEPARLSGGAVSDVTHLLAELLENAIQFSAPSETIRVTGLFGMGGYQLAVSDRGVGMSEARIAEMNRILERPPALGLSVEPTLGMYVVAKLAHRHALDVELIRGVPGLTVKVTIPRDHLEVDEEPAATQWGSESTESLPAANSSSGPSPLDYRDSESRAYVLNKRQEHKTEDPAPVCQEPPDEQVIDLTESTYNVPEADRRPGGLPVRTPGRAFSHDDDSDARVSPGESASRIKAALAAYEVGRRSAVEAEEDEGSSRLSKDRDSEDRS